MPCAKLPRPFLTARTNAMSHSKEFTAAQKAAVLDGNARRFYLG